MAPDAAGVVHANSTRKRTTLLPLNGVVSSKATMLAMTTVRAMVTVVKKMDPTAPVRKHGSPPVDAVVLEPDPTRRLSSRP